MPCDTITTVKLELLNANLELLKKAMAETLKIPASSIRQSENGLSWSRYSYNKQTGQLTTRTDREGQQIKRAYSGELVKQQAKRFGWLVKETKPFTYEIVKR